MGKKLWTVGEAAQHFGVPPWTVNRLFRRGLLPEPERVGPFRVIFRSQLTRVRRALRQHGYLK